jgi:hypothetical protein
MKAEPHPSTPLDVALSHLKFLDLLLVPSCHRRCHITEEQRISTLGERAKGLKEAKAVRDEQCGRGITLVFRNDRLSRTRPRCRACGIWMRETAGRCPIFIIDTSRVVNLSGFGFAMYSEPSSQFFVVISFGDARAFSRARELQMERLL